MHSTANSNSLAIKLGSSHCRLAHATITEWGNVHLENLNGIDEQFATKTCFTLRGCADFNKGYEQCLAGKEHSDPSNIVFDALNLQNNNLACYMDPKIGNIFAEKDSENENYDLKFCDENNPLNWKNVQFKDIEVVAGILHNILNVAKEQLNKKADGIRHFVITVPSLSGYVYREKLLKALKILGLPSPDVDILLIAQITAAAIAYRRIENDEAQGHVLFFYIGATNTECAIYNFLDGQTPKFHCLKGFVDFGGENFTWRLVENKIETLKRGFEQEWAKMEDREKRMVYRNVRLAMEEIKVQLGYMDSVKINKDLGPTLQGQQFTMNREEFEAICEAESQKLKTLLAKVFKKASIRRIVLAGNSSKLYLVKNIIHEHCAENANKMFSINTLPPELAVVHGAAIKAAANEYNSPNVDIVVSKCLSRALVPCIAFRGIYLNKFLTGYRYQMFPGTELPTKKKLMTIERLTEHKWFEEKKINYVGKNDEEILKFSLDLSVDFKINVNKNGLLQFRYIDGKLFEQENPELEKYRQRFIAYESDERKVKNDYEELEKTRGQRKYSQIERKKVNNIKEHLNEKADLENKKPDENGHLEVENQPKIAESLRRNSRLISVLFQYPHKKSRDEIKLCGSWNDWANPILMKYSILMESFIALVQIKPGEHEFCFQKNDDNELFYYINDYEARVPLKCKDWEWKGPANVINLPDEQRKNLENEKLESKNQILKTITDQEKKMLKIWKGLTKECSAITFGKFKSKYLEIRTSFPVVINLCTLNVWADEVDRLQIYLNLIVAFSNWEKIKEQNFLLKKSRNVHTIDSGFKKELHKFRSSKEEIISWAKNNFVMPMIEQCHRIGLEKKSKEIQQLNEIEKICSPPLTNHNIR